MTKDDDTAALIERAKELMEAAFRPLDWSAAEMIDEAGERCKEIGVSDDFADGHTWWPVAQIYAHYSKQDCDAAAALIAAAPTLITDLAAALERAQADAARMREQKDGAYAERDRLVAALSKVFPSWLGRHPDADTTWEDDWRWIVFIAFPAGQASWHIHDSELAWFDHLERRSGNSWDGHTTPEKYERVAALEPRHD